MIADVWGSLVKYLQERYPAWTYCDWEDHANMSTVPASDCIGLNGLGAVADEGTDTIAFSVGVSSFNDTNLFRHRAAVDSLFEDLRKPGRTIVLYDAATAVAKGRIVITDGTVLAPMGRAEMRPFQVITAHAKLT